jgi:GNAT superfamily N-acetyltransferase
MVTVHAGTDGGAIATMLELERTFRPALRYENVEFRRRFSHWNAYVVQVWSGGEPVAFAIASADPALPDHAIFLDSMSVAPRHQGRGIGSAIHRFNLCVPSFAGYTSAQFYCERLSSSGVDLVALYTSLGGRVVAADADKVTMTAPVRLELGVANESSS